ncbi:hypothetical protein SDC9_86814 [bioreactor metagenome]|uniref:DUF218 domain-containing protein n=1 Tax=bioreactor metagenome TaxID=1076179 RepID=A0A644ZRE3_9ZZZZ
MRPYRPYKGKRNIFFRAALILLALAIAGFLLLEGLVLAGSRTEVHGQPQVMVILGAQVKSWGPSILLQDRLDTALAWLEEHPDMTVVVTGGQGADEPTTEARCMYDYLTARGVDGKQILMDEESHNTSQNLKNAKSLIEKNGMDPAENCLVVSNGFHLTRVRMLSYRYGMDVSTLAAPSSHIPSRISCTLRESAALLKSFLLD